MAARLLFVGGNPPSVRDTARRSLLLLDDAVGLADGDGCPAAWRNGGGAWGARAPARDYYISLLTLSSYPFPLPTSSIPHPGLLSNNVANVTSYNMMFGTQTFFTRVPPREMRRPRRP